MAFVITGRCCDDASCIPVCPVDCIRPRPDDPEFATAEQLYIDPVTCIDCGACVWECPISAISDEHELPGELQVFKGINAAYFDEHPLEERASPVGTRRRLIEQQPALRVAVVGAGAAGSYAAAELAAIAGVEVSLFDRLPTPFGLVRSGVAPDHQQTKTITALFQKTLARTNVHSYFGVELGRDVSVAELLERHHAVLVAVGAGGDRRLGIPGEELPGSHSAREFVAWYNGHPEHAEARFDLTGDRVVVIGNGNVALDVARVLAAPAASFETTDIADPALAALRDSAVREVVVSARRGAADAAYTTAEFLALLGTEGVEVATRADEVAAGTGSAGPAASASPRFGSDRRVELARGVAQSDDALELPVANGRRILFRFGLTPESIDDDGDGRVGSVTFRRGDRTETLATSLVLRAIGYRSTPLPGIPFDEAGGTIPSIDGRITGEPGGAALPGLYCTGWARRGAGGIIGTNKPDAAGAVAALFDDYAAGRLPDPPLLGDEVEPFVRSRVPDVVDAAGWAAIDAAETAAGRTTAPSRPRQKLITVAELLAASRR